MGSRLAAFGWIMLWAGLALGDIGDYRPGTVFTIGGALAVIGIIAGSVLLGYVAGYESREADEWKGE